MNKKKKNRPTLRFPEFEGEWEETKLFNIILNISPPKKLKSSQFQENGKYPIIDQSQNDIAGYTDDEKALVKDEFPLIVFGDHTCTLKIIENPFVQGADGIKIFKGKIKVIDTRYLYYALQNEPFITKEYKRHYSILKERIISFPRNRSEQQKIATCFSSLDDLITAHQEKLTNLKAHKKGLLQNLFPKAGEKVPRLRFDGFEGEWEERTLNDVAQYTNGKAHEKEISEAGRYKVVNSKFVSTDGEVVKYTNSPNLKAAIGDILMVLSDVPNGKAIAKCFYVDEDDTYTVNQRICKITPTNIVNKFLIYILNRNPYFLRFDDGVKQTNLRKDNVLSFPFLKPKDPKEQQKIANCLSSLDDLISAQQQKIIQLQAHKKGLLQRMFI